MIICEHRDWLLEQLLSAGFYACGMVDEVTKRDLQVDYRTFWESVHIEKLTYKLFRVATRASRFIISSVIGGLLVARLVSQPDL